MKDDRRFYVYVHKRATDGSPFYYGKGTGKRAFTLVDYFRSEHHRRVKEKYGCIVEILFDNLTEDEAKKIEIEQIKLAKERGENIVNVTPGGEGIGSEQASRMGKITREKQVGIFGRTKEEIIRDAGKAGKIGGSLPWWYNPITGKTTRTPSIPLGFVPGRGPTLSKTLAKMKAAGEGIFNPEVQLKASKLGAERNVAKHQLAKTGVFKRVTCSCGREMNVGNLDKHQKASGCKGVKS